VVLKGDLTNRGRPEEWDLLGEIVRDLPIPHVAVPGNHDVQRRVPGSVALGEGVARAGLTLHTGVAALDHPGVRLVLVDTTVPDTNRGRLPRARTETVLDALRASDRPAVVVLHHHLLAAPVNWFWPPGVPFLQARRFLAAVEAARPGTLLTSGHTHRHRRRDTRSLVLTEVGSPKDFPGTWAGYAVHEGGIRQVVRRVEAPECASWLERTRRGAWGTWGLWSPGPLRSRCFSHPWQQ
jgi:3',5'-cyclic AMP phosphodiesterase CpdA